jgi:hypothetical protein
MKTNEPTLKFWSNMNVYGDQVYLPANERAVEVANLIGQGQDELISDEMMDRIYDVMDKLHIDVVIEEKPKQEGNYCGRE